MTTISLKDIYIRFFRIGTLLLGGGYVILPLLQSEIAEKYDCITDDDVCEYYAISQSLPGVIAVNTAVFVGYKLARTKGALAAITGMVTPAFLSIILLANLLTQIVHVPFVQNLFLGVGIGVLALLFQAVNEMWKKSIVDKGAFIIFLASFIALILFKVFPIYIVISGIVLGVILGFIRSRRGVEK